MTPSVSRVPNAHLQRARYFFGEPARRPRILPAPKGYASEWPLDVELDDDPEGYRHPQLVFDPAIFDPLHPETFDPPGLRGLARVSTSNDLMRARPSGLVAASTCTVTTTEEMIPDQLLRLSRPTRQETSVYKNKPGSERQLQLDVEDSPRQEAKNLQKKMLLGIRALSRMAIIRDKITTQSFVEIPAVEFPSSQGSESRRILDIFQQLLAKNTRTPPRFRMSSWYTRWH
ncbi:hypothetical protein GGR54DRAFT_649267 [Hypoxylon sp. NC1633]|nr:hypothetical protein GGR54DRAFT_649267 [Hypoxylon sp. NC1633]